jgi:hypothetical protein
MSLKKFIENQETSLKKLIKERDKNLANIIYKEYCIPVEDIMKLFEKYTILLSKCDEDNSNKCDEDNSNKCDEDNSNKCSYVFKRGVKAGKNCNTIIKNTEEYCSKHKTKKSKKDSNTKKSKKDSNTKKPMLILRKHRFFKNYFFHKETGFLVKNKKEGVIGKIKENKDTEPEIVELTEEDITKCLSLGLQFKNLKMVQ